jgi:tetratricopeptide (TPR) repeat protein
LAIRDSFKKLFSSREGDDRTALSKRVQAAPEDPQARQKLGVFLLKQGEVVEGIDQLARAAVLYEKSGFAAKAIAVLRQMLKHDPGNIDLQRWLVRLLAQQGLMADALHELERITSGGVRFSSEDQKVDFLRQAAEHLSGHPLPLLLIVDVLRSQRKFFEAVNEMEKAAPLAVASGQVGAFGDRLKGLITLAGTNLESLESFGFLWIRVGNLEAGLSVLRQVVQMTRKVGHAADFESMERVMAAIAQGHGALRQATSFADAARILAAPPPAPKAAAPAPPPQKAERPPERREAPGPRGPASPGRPPQTASPPAGAEGPGEAASSEEEDLVRSAIGLLQEKVREQIGESDHEARYNLGIAYKEMGLLDEAIEEFRVSRRKPDLFIGASTMLAETLAERGDIDAAMEALNETLGSDRVLGTQARDILYQKGLLLEKAGKAGEAMEIFLSIYEEAPDYRDVRGRTEGYRK